MEFDDRWMGLALAEAVEAGRGGEVPIGAVVVVGERVVGRGFNRPIGSSDPTAHAEIVALREASRTLGNYRLEGATLYATVEPCPMCYGAALHARLARLVYGAADPKIGATRAFEALGAGFNHRFEVRGGVLADRCAQLLRDFFRERRGGESAA